MKRNVIIGCLGGLLLVSGVWFIHTHQGDQERINELEAQVVALQRQQENSELDRSVSEQMEHIAQGQQALSEERSQEAIRQSEIAQAATLRSEAERRNAVKAHTRSIRPVTLSWATCWRMPPTSIPTTMAATSIRPLCFKP